MSASNVKKSKIQKKNDILALTPWKPSLKTYLPSMFFSTTHKTFLNMIFSFQNKKRTKANIFSCIFRNCFLLFSFFIYTFVWFEWKFKRKAEKNVLKVEKEKRCGGENLKWIKDIFSIEKENRKGKFCAIFCHF